MKMQKSGKSKFLLFTLIVRKIVIICLLILSLINKSTSQQEKKVYMPEIEIENSEQLNDYQYDFIYLTKLLEDTHPNIFDNFPKEKYYEEKKLILKKLEKVEIIQDFIFIVQPFIAAIKDGHTSISYNCIFNQPNLPIEFRWVKDKLYIVDADTSLSEKIIGAEVIKYNNLSSADLFELAGNILSSENVFFRKALMEYLFMLSNHDLISFYTGKSEKLPLMLNLMIESNEHKFEIVPKKPKKYISHNLVKKHYITKKTNIAHSYILLMKHNACYYQFNHCTYNVQTETHPDYVSFLDEMFGKIKENNINKLIVDLRNNTGGDSIIVYLFMYYSGYPEKMKQPVSDKKYSKLLLGQRKKYLNRYNSQKIKKELPYIEKAPKRPKYFKLNNEIRNLLKEKPKFQKFDGKIILIVGRKTYSSASFLPLFAKDNKIPNIKIIGEPVGQKPTCFGDVLNYTLPKTKITGTISFKKWWRPDPEKDKDPTIYPDIEIYPTIDDIMNGEDPVFEKALEM